LNRVVSNNTIFPTKIVKGDWYAMPIIDDYMALKPKPEKDVCLILGDGANLFQDIEAFYGMAEGVVEYDTMCVNYAALVCPHPFQHFAAGDAHLPDMQAVAKRIPKAVLKHAWNPGCYDFDIRWIRNGRGGWNGTSANLAFKIALSFDYTRIVLAGCPMDDSGNWYRPIIPDNDIKKNKDHRHHLWKWMEIACRPVGHFVRSMSGNTADLLGRPTLEWLCHLQDVPEKEEQICQKMN
jgi:hypothetical protein